VFVPALWTIGGFDGTSLHSWMAVGYAAGGFGAGCLMNVGQTYFYVETVSNNYESGQTCVGPDGTQGQTDHARSPTGLWNIYWYGLVDQGSTHLLELRYVDSS